MVVDQLSLLIKLPFGLRERTPKFQLFPLSPPDKRSAGSENQIYAGSSSPQKAFKLMEENPEFHISHVLDRVTIASALSLNTQIKKLERLAYRFKTMEY
jgi:hypothetical protein